jgi:hypothetical protein
MNSISAMVKHGRKDIGPNVAVVKMKIVSGEDSLKWGGGCGAEC